MGVNSYWVVCVTFRGWPKDRIVCRAADEAEARAVARSLNAAGRGRSLDVLEARGFPLYWAERWDTSNSLSQSGPWEEGVCDMDQVVEVLQR